LLCRHLSEVVGTCVEQITQNWDSSRGFADSGLPDKKRLAEDIGPPYTASGMHKA